MTCCGGKNQAGGCVCAETAKCSCGKQAAGACTCEKAATENNVVGATCACGKRPANACTCEKPAAEETASNDNEVDFTTTK